MTLQPEMNEHVWQILDIDHDKRMVALISTSSPTVKRFGVPHPIQWAEVLDQVLCIYCEDFVAWHIQISDGARRKLTHKDKR
jgi:hypothetical protein